MSIAPHEGKSETADGRKDAGAYEIQPSISFSLLSLRLSLKNKKEKTKKTSLSVVCRVSEREWEAKK
jgi:hypothetical protein